MTGNASWSNSPKASAGWEQKPPLKFSPAQPRSRLTARDIINLGIGQPDFRTPDHIVEAAVKALRDGEHGYTPAQGILPLREAVAQDLRKRHGVEVSPDNVVIMPGGKPTMFFSILMFATPGRQVMYPDPGFPIYRSMIEYAGAEPVPIALLEENGFAFSAEQVLADITPSTSLIILNAPGNPTGGAVPVEEIEKLVAGLADHPHVAVLADEIYSQMLYDGREHVSLLRFPQLRDRLILLDGWSKTYAMTGWRLGFSVWPDALVEPVVRLAVNCHSCVNAPTQFAGIAALEGPQDARPHYGRRIRRAPSRDRTDAQSTARLSVRRAWRRLLCVSEYFRNRHDGQAAADPDVGRSRRGNSCRHQLRNPRRGLHSVFLCQLKGEHRPCHRADRHVADRLVQFHSGRYGRSWGRGLPTSQFFAAVNQLFTIRCYGLEHYWSGSSHEAHFLIFGSQVVLWAFSRA